MIDRPPSSALPGPISGPPWTASEERLGLAIGFALGAFVTLVVVLYLGLFQISGHSDPYDDRAPSTIAMRAASGAAIADCPFVLGLIISGWILGRRPGVRTWRGLAAGASYVIGGYVVGRLVDARLMSPDSFGAYVGLGPLIAAPFVVWLDAPLSRLRRPSP